MTVFNHPEGRNRLLNHIVDDIAQNEPQKLFAEIPLSPTSFDQGFRKVTYLDLSNAINGVAAFLERSIGGGQNFPTLVYFGPPDLRYVVLLLAAVKAGYKMLFPSPRFSPVAAIELIKKTGAKTMLLPKPYPPVALSILHEHPMISFEVPDLDELLDTQYPPYPYERTFEQARNEPLVTLHTSGSTGFPKPIIWTHGWAASFAEELYLAPPSGYESTTALILGRRIFQLFPAFHAGHLMGALLFPILTGTVNVYPLPGEPPSGDQVANVLAHNQIDILCLIPPVIEQIGRNPQLLQKLSAHVDQMMWSGGDISTEAGNAISTRFKLFSQVGSTEVGLFHHIRPAEEWNYENWHYVGFHPSSNVQLIHREGRSHEAVVQRNTNDYTQTVFNLFPESLEYTTGDLFTQHPHQSQLWEYQGRSDDMLVFLSGEKFYPVDVERILCRNPGIQEAILIGTGRSQAALLLDLVRGNDEHDGDIHKTLERIWPVIDATNELSPAYAKVSRDCILVVDPKRPIIRTAKGNVQRNATIKLYQNEITKLDEAAANSNATVPHTACELLTEGSTM